MKKFLSIALVCILVGLASCSPDNPSATFYTVGFDSDGGSGVPSQKVEAGGVAIKPDPDPTRADYTFLYWQLKGDGSVANVPRSYDFSTAVTGDITLIAVWQKVNTAENWQITWELDGGAWPLNYDPVVQVEKGQPLGEPAIPVKSGATFGGWYSDSSLSTPVTFPLAVSSDIKLYAKWTAANSGGKFLGKWNARNKNKLGIVSIEFSEDYYFVTMPQDDVLIINIGEYEIDGSDIYLDDPLDMSVTIDSFDESSLALTIPVPGESSDAIVFDKVVEIPSSSRTDLLCRLWVVIDSSSSDPEFVEPADVGARYYFSKAGTVTAWSNGEQGNPGKWRWKSALESDRGIVLTLWDDEEGEWFDLEWPMSVQTLTETEMVTYEDMGDGDWAKTWFKAVD